MVDGVVPLNGCGGTGENDLNNFLANGSDCLTELCDIVTTRENWNSSNRTALLSELTRDRTYPAFILGRNTPTATRVQRSAARLTPRVAARRSPSSGSSA
jgi:hypothetical protein